MTEREGNFGWRYFHFVDPAGVWVNVVVHETDIFGLETEPYMTMMVKKSGREVERFKGKPSWIWERDEQKGNGQFSFEFGNSKLTGLVEEVPEFKGLTEVVLGEDEIGRKSMWSVEVPYGKIRAKLTAEAGETHLSGYMYQDRQWGDLPLQKWVSDWTWIHLATDKYFAIVFAINSNDGRMVRHGAYGLKEITTTDTLEVSFFSQLIHAEKFDDREFNGEIKMGNNFSTFLVLTPEQIMRLRMNERYEDFLASYTRWAVNMGIVEYMRIRKV